MAKSWRDYISVVRDAQEACDTRDISDNSPVANPNVTIVPNVPAKLPPDIRAGLIALKSMAAPRLIIPERWPDVVSDALSLARDGWAAKALALGWSSLDLFGAVTDFDGPRNADGLAAWLARRPLLAICATYASAADGNGRAYFNRCDRLGQTLLWEIGR